MPLRTLISAGLLAVLAVVASWLPGHAAEPFPARQVTLVVPLTPGTTIDILARLYADKLGKLLGQQVIVLNRPGAGGIVGAESVATAAPDGYTLLFGNSGHSILGLLNKNLAFDPIKDFAGVSMIGAAPAIVVVPSSLGLSDLTAFVALAEAKPGQLNYGSAGVGTATHLAGAYFAAQTGINIVHVPYTVSSNIISDMLSGAIQASFDPLAFVLSFLQNGSLRALAVGADAPVAEPVKIPTAASQGVDYHFATWYGVLAPVKTPKPVLRTLADAIAAASRDGELQQKIKAQGIRPDIVPLDAFDSYIDGDLERLAPLTKDIAEK
jgi:tripartite-type tricarboxylate transporter receptor subunit TctC